MERAVNTLFDFGDTKIQVVENKINSCLTEDGGQCFFFSKEDCVTPYVGYCSACTRNDNKNVIFLPWKKK